jgi:hypothetical protein
MKVAIFPPHHHLQDDVELIEAHITADFESPPDLRIAVRKDYLDLINFITAAILPLRHSSPPMLNNTIQKRNHHDNTNMWKRRRESPGIA